MKKKLVSFLLFMLFFPIVLNAEELNLSWENLFSGNDFENPCNLVVSDDGSVFIFGDTWSTDFGAQEYNDVLDTYLVKYSKDGELLWQNVWGGSAFDNLYYMHVLKDGSVVLFGYSDSDDISGVTNMGDRDIIIVKYDKDGKILWQKSYGTGSSDMVENVVLSDNEEFVLVGLYNDLSILKLNEKGELLWKNEFGNGYYDSSDKIELNVDLNNSYIVSGTFYNNYNNISDLTSNGLSDVFILKYSDNGQLLWKRSWGGSNSEKLNKIVMTEDGGYVAIGSIDSTDINGITSNNFAIKYDSNGNLLWQKNLEDTEYYELDILSKEEWLKTDFDKIYDFYVNDFGDYTVIGNPLTYNGEAVDSNVSFMISKYDKNKKLLWQVPYIGIGKYHVTGHEITNKDIIVTLSYESDDRSFDILTIKYNLEYDVSMIDSINGNSSILLEDDLAIVNVNSNDGYEVDTIVVKDKDGNKLDVEVNKLDDGTYSFQLYTDVSVEVLFKEVLVNPKTGVRSIIGSLFTIFLIGVCALFMIKNCNNSLEL